jgi:hypothetical protein
VIAAMRNRVRSLLALVLCAGALLRAESSEYPLAINLPTGERMQFWDMGIAFTHRFIAPVQNNGKNLYGIDNFAYAGFGFDFGFKPIKGLNVLVYRTADNKTFVFGLQQLLLDRSKLRLSLRLERFDETVQNRIVPGSPDPPQGEIGISGASGQLTAEIFITDDIILTLVPTYLSRTTTLDKGVFTGGAGLKIHFSEKFAFVGEYYPTPAKVKKIGETGGVLVQKGRVYSNGFAAGFSYKTFKHRFALFGTNSTGTTTHQVLGGDYGGGPNPNGKWSLGFNVARVF